MNFLRAKDLGEKFHLWVVPGGAKILRAKGELKKRWFVRCGMLGLKRDNRDSLEKGSGYLWGRLKRNKKQLEHMT